jgi:dihydrofolate synthase/folylpolyglutamate synthase
MEFKTIDEGILYIRALISTGIKYNLIKITKLLNLLDNPQKDLKIVHITGTNGKGSVASYISTVLTNANYKTFLFTSPHLVKYNERFKINNQDISDEKLLYYLNFLKPYIDKMSQEFNEPPSFFEIMTTIAFLYAKDEKVDISILEVGLGGKFDATNVIKKNLISIITNIEIDHIKSLGNSLNKIADHKFDIIKKNSVVISGITQNNLILKLKKKAKKENAPLYILNQNFSYKITKESLYNSYNLITDKKEIKNIKCGLIGKHQITNSSIATIALLKLKELGYKNLNLKIIKEGIKNTTWSGRFEKFIINNKTIYLDGAHNRAGI